MEDNFYYDMPENLSLGDNTDLTKYPKPLKAIPLWEMSVKVVAYIIVIIFSLVGNFLIIYVVLTNRRMRSTTNYYMVNLAIADLLVTISCSWVHLVSDLTEGWVLGPFFCKFNSFSQVLSLIASVLTLSLIAYDRFFGIVFALRAHMTERRARWFLLVIWISSVAIASPLLVYRKVFTWKWLDHVEIWCDDSWPEQEIVDDLALHEMNGTSHGVSNAGILTRKYYYTFVSVVLYFVPVIVMIFSYSIIIWRLWSTEAPGESSQINSSVQERTKRKVIVMLVVIMLVFALCWLPYQVTIIYSEHRTNQHEPLQDWYPKVQFFALYLAYSNSALNPLIYACFNENFRQGFKEVARKARCIGYSAIDANQELTTMNTVVTRDTPTHNAVSLLPKHVRSRENLPKYGNAV